MQEICPTTDTGKKTYAVSMFSDWDGDMVMFVKATAAIYGYDEFGFGLYDMNTQTYQDALDKNGMYLRCLKFYNTLYQRGLVDPDSMTQTFDDCYADYKDGAADFFAVALLIAAAVYVIALTYVFACAVAFVLRSRLVYHQDFREARGTACPA